MTTINLNNKQYKLHFDFHALTLFEEHSNYNLQTITQALTSLKGLNILIYSGLQKYHSNEFTTPQELNKLLDLSQLETIIKQVSKSLEEAFKSPQSKPLSQ